MTLPPYGSPMVTQLFGVNLRSDSSDPTAARHKRFPGQHAHEDLPQIQAAAGGFAKQVGPFGGPQMAVLFEISHSDPFHTLDLHDP